MYSNIYGLLAGLVLVVMPLTVAAQSGQTVPMELAQRLADQNGLTQTQVFVGTLPPSMDSSIPQPKGVRLLGAVTQNEPLNIVELFYETAQPSRTVAEAYGLALIKSGWKKSESPGLPHGGFKPSFGGYTMYCRGKAIAISVQTPPRSKNDLRIAVSRHEQGDPCESFGAQQIMERFKTPLPDLVAPPGSQMTPASAGVTTGDSGATIKTSSSLSVILSSFAGQMRNAGWALGATAQTPSLGSQVFHVVDAQKQQWQAVLTIYASDIAANTYYAFVDVTNLTSQSKDNGSSWQSSP